MSCELYLVVGLAKTGTTAVAMSLANTLKVPDVLLEPKELTTIERFSASCERVVIKIIFDHWQHRVDALKALIYPTLRDDAPTTIVIVRDPRDEAVSRLHYAAYDYFSTRPTTQDERTAWIDIFRRKEETPDSVAFMDMQSHIISRFRVGFLPERHLYDAYCQFIDDISAPGSAGVHLLRYEDFVRETIQDELLRTLLSGSHDVGPTLRRVFRSGSSGDWQHFLTDQDLAVINDSHEPFLRRFEYPFERSSALGRPSRATGSDYVTTDRRSMRPV
ncbi:MAG: sulfotransferase domain-containing protein [Terriglobales bacterium]